MPIPVRAQPIAEPAQPQGHARVPHAVPEIVSRAWPCSRAAKRVMSATITASIFSLYCVNPPQCH